MLDEVGDPDSRGRGSRSAGGRPARWLGPRRDTADSARAEPHSKREPPDRPGAQLAPNPLAR
jgi:hypothetical protein